MVAPYPLSKCTPVKSIQLCQVGHVSGLNLFINNLTGNILCLAVYILSFFSGIPRKRFKSKIFLFITRQNTFFIIKVLKQENTILCDEFAWEHKHKTMC